MARKSKDPTMTNVYTLGIGMSMTLLGIKVAMNFVVPIFGNYGSTCMALLMFSSAFACFIIPPVLGFFKNERQCLSLLCVEYGLFVLGFVYFVPYLSYAWSLVHGCVAAVLWAAEGIYLSANMNEHDKGVKSGIFWGVYMSGTIIGNLVGYFILRFVGLGSNSKPEGWHGSASYMFLFLGVISIFGAIPMYMLKPSPSESSRQPISSTPTKILIQRVLKMTVSRDMIWMLLPMAYLGFQYSYLGCMLTRQIIDTSSVGLLMALYSLVETVISTTLGSLMDKYGNLCLMNIATITQLISMITVWFANFSQGYLYYVTFILLAISDSAYQIIVPAVLGGKYSDQETANSVFRLFQNMGGCICYLIASPFIKEGETMASPSMYAAELWLNILFALLSHMSFVVFRHVDTVRVPPKTDLPIVDEKKVDVLVSNEDLDMITSSALDTSKTDIDWDGKNVAKSNENFVQ